MYFVWTNNKKMRIHYMKRTRQIKKPDLILCSDFHLRDDVPVCRTDNYLEKQWYKLGYIGGLQSKYNCPILHGGDLLNHYKSSPWLLSQIIRYLPAKFFSCSGQHDLQNHNIKLLYKSGFNTLIEAGVLKTARDWELELDYHIEFCSYGEEPSMITDSKTKNILVWHKLAYQTPPYPGVTGGNAKQLLHKYYMYSLIITGDNHLAFVEEYQGRLLVNPGSMMRMSADQINYKPCVFLWFAEDNTVQQVFLPIEQGVITCEHIEANKKRDERIMAFISKLDTDYIAEMSFEDNLESFFQKNNIREPVKQIIYKAIEK